MNYKIGQRVRVVVAERHPEFCGLTGRIASALKDPTPSTRPPPYSPTEPVHHVEFDNLPEFAKGRIWHFAPWQLEPIMPEGMALSTWSECVWQPEHLREQIQKVGVR